MKQQGSPGDTTPRVNYPGGLEAREITDVLSHLLFDRRR
jgi:hypothetical protein